MVNMDPQRRSLLRSVAVAGSVGLAGCFGGGSGGPTATPAVGIPDETETDHMGTTERGQSPTEPSPHATATPTRSPSRNRNTTAATRARWKECLAPCDLFGYQEVELEEGTTGTVEGTVMNPHLFTITNLRITLEPPGDNWSVTPPNPIQIEQIEPQEEHHVEWQVSIPESVSTEPEGSVTISFSKPDEEGQATVTVPFQITGS